MSDVPVRCVVVEWPDWPLVAARATPGLPSAVMRANRVVAASPLARDEGIRPGWRRRESQRACASLVVIDHDSERDMRVFEPLVRSMGAITPLVEVDRAGRCTFATRGPSRYHGGDAALAELTLATMCSASPAPAVAVTGPPVAGIADGAFTARLAARSVLRSECGFSVIDVGESPAYLAPFPIDVLTEELGDDSLTNLFSRLGIRTLGALAALPYVDVLTRFGPLGADAHRLARGLDRRPPQAREPLPDLAIERRFDDPVVTSGPLAFVGKQMGDELLERLAANGLACTQIFVVAEADNGDRSERLWRHEPAFTAASLAERVRWQLDGWNTQSTARRVLDSARPPGSGAAGAEGLRSEATGGSRSEAAASTARHGVVLLRVVPTEVVAATGEQRGFWGGRSESDERAGRGIARLVGLLGPEAVHVPERQGGRQVSEAVVMVPAVASEHREAGVSRGSSPMLPPWPGHLPDPAPATVWNPPLSARLVDAAGHLVQVTSRGFVSAPPSRLTIADEISQLVTGWSAPWPLEERWWDKERSRRCARFQIVTESGDAYLVVVETGQWWVQATYD
jgi:protein ImuB